MRLRHRPTCPRGYHRGITVDISALHHDFLPLRPKEILYYILRELQHAKHDKDEGQEEEEGEKDSSSFLQDYRKKWSIHLEKKKVFYKIKEQIKMDEIYRKLDRIKSGVKARQNMDNKKQLYEDLEQKKDDQLGLEVHFQLLLESAAAAAATAASQQDRVKNKNMHKLPACDDKSIMTIAEKLKQYIEADEEAKDLVGVVEEVGKSRAQYTEEEEKEGEDGTRRDSWKEKDDKEQHNKENEKEKGGGERKKENDAKEEEEKGGGEDGAREESKEEEENERQKKEKEKKGKEAGGEGRKKNKQEQEEERDEEEGNEGDEASYYLPSFFYEDYGEEGGEEGEEEHPVHLHKRQYARIIREVFEKTINNKSLQAQQQDRFEAKNASKTTATMLSEDLVKEIIHETKQEVLKELQEGKLDKNKVLSEYIDTAADVSSQNKKDDSEFEQKFEEMKLKFKEQLKIKGLLDKIKDHLKSDCPLIVIKVDWRMDGSLWEETRKALSLLECSADALIFTTIKDIHWAKGYCHPSREPIDYSLVGLYHHIVLELTSKQKNEDNYNPQLFRDILEECKHEFCMKIFTHALHSNPKRSTEELKSLQRSLRDSPKSFDMIAKKMFKYSYNDLPKEYKSCLLYLAIFPKGKSIRRSTLVGRWVTEGLIFKEDWHSSVLEANRCFNALINRWLIYPADIGATGKVKSCMVGDLVHGFITAIARKQHIVETRLSHRFARHFSIFNDLRLRNTDKIDKFLEMLSESSQLSLHKLKVLDLEGCRCFGGKKNERYLKEICSKMLLLKYLSLRGTDIRHLPDQINNLRELEVLDIRETKMPANATVNVLLLKLKRLLAGSSPSNSVISSSVRIPHNIRKMENMEVLSNVEAKSKRDFKEIGYLTDLRKLGVVFQDKDSHIKYLLETVNNLHECLCSLSITLSSDTFEGIPSSEELLPRACSAAISSACCSRSCTLMNLSLCTGPAAAAAAAASAAEQAATVYTQPKLELFQPPKHLESLSISGTKGRLLLPWFANDGNNTLAKVTLSNTRINHVDMEILAKVPNLRCLRLRYINACTEGVLTFNKDGFKCLKYLLVEASNLNSIIFEVEAAQELEMMALSSTMIRSVSEAGQLPKLEELELKNNQYSSNLLLSLEDAKQITKLTLRGTLPEQGDLQILAKKPNIQCLVLLCTSCDATQNMITFNKDEFPKLNLLIVHSPAITDIVFAKGSAHKLQKIIWSSGTRLSGICNLPRLKELESYGGPIPDEVKKDIREHQKKPEHKHIEQEIPDQVIIQDDDDNKDGRTRFPFCWKKRG